MYKILLPAFIVSVFFTQCLCAHYEITPDCEKALKAILSLKTETAREIIATEYQKKPDNLYNDYLLHWVDVIELISFYDKQKYEKFLKNLDHRLDKMEKSPTETPYNRVIMAEMLAQSALVSIKFGDEFSGFKKLYRANKYMKENFKRYPDFWMNKKLGGFFNIAFDNIPNSFKWVVSAFGMKGDKDLGYNQLISYQNELKGRPGLYSESLIYLVLAYKVSNDEEGAYHTLKRYYDPRNHAFLDAFFYANIMYKTGNNEEALKVLSGLKSTSSEVPFHHLAYLLGKAKLHRLDKDAAQYLKEFLQKSKNENYIKEINHKLSCFYLLHGDETKYLHYKSVVLSGGRDFTDRDREALVEAQRSYAPHPELLKARFLVAGGYYSRAASILQYVEYSELNMEAYKVEYLLLRGKIMAYDKEYLSALENYQSAYNNGKKLSEHFAAEAALMAGLLAKKYKDFPKAAAYFDSCLKTENQDNIFLEIIEKKAKDQMMILKKTKRS